MVPISKSFLFRFSFLIREYSAVILSSVSYETLLNSKDVSFSKALIKSKKIPLPLLLTMGMLFKVAKSITLFLLSSIHFFSITVKVVFWSSLVKKRTTPIEPKINMTIMAIIPTFLFTAYNLISIHKVIFRFIFISNYWVTIIFFFGVN